MFIHFCIILVGAGEAFAQERADIQERLSRTYGKFLTKYNFRKISKFWKIPSGGGDMDSFPALEFQAPDLHQDAIDGERTIEIEVSL